MSQSPSLRGSGRFGPRRPSLRGLRLGLNPLHCGAVVASRRVLPSLAPERGVSIPFIAGQWSLRGWGRAPGRGARQVSIPFIAGQWSLRGAAARLAAV